MWRTECILVMVDHLPQIQMFQTTGSYILDMAREREEKKKEVLALLLHVHMYTYSISAEIQNSHSLHKLCQWFQRVLMLLV